MRSTSLSVILSDIWYSFSTIVTIEVNQKKVDKNYVTFPSLFYGLFIWQTNANMLKLNKLSYKDH